MTQVIDEVTLTNEITEKDKPNQSMRLFIDQVVNNSLIIGTGTPENAIEANQDRLYMDDAGGTGTILYIKKVAAIGGDLKQGWILV